MRSKSLRRDSPEQLYARKQICNRTAPAPLRNLPALFQTLLAGEQLSESLQLWDTVFSKASSRVQMAVVCAAAKQWVRFREELSLGPEELMRQIKNGLLQRPAHVAIVHCSGQNPLTAMLTGTELAMIIVQEEIDGTNTLFHLQSTWGTGKGVGSLLLAATCRSVAPAELVVWPAKAAAHYFQARNFTGPTVDFEETLNSMSAPSQIDDTCMRTLCGKVASALRPRLAAIQRDGRSMPSRFAIASETVRGVTATRPLVRARARRTGARVL